MIKEILSLPKYYWDNVVDRIRIMAETKGLSKDSAISIGLLIVIIGAVAGAASWASTVSLRLKSIESTLREGTHDGWTGKDMRSWVKAANREVEIWSITLEQQLELAPGTGAHFKFPDPGEIPD